MNNGNFGWVFNQTRIDIAAATMQAAGVQTAFSASRPSLAGYWKRQILKGVTRVSAQDDEKKLNGSWRKPNSQRRGTCVGQGSSRAIEDVQISRLADGAYIGKYVQIAYEVMYGYERAKHWGKTHPWGCNCGRCPDGLQGADAAAFYSTIGVLARGIYDGVDLTLPREELAIQWNNTGVPEVLIAAAAFHKIQGHLSPSWDDYADCMAAKCWGHICLPKIASGHSFDQNGCTHLDGSGGHDTSVFGVVVLPNHKTGFMIQQSWGDAVKYPPIVQTASGPLEMRPGSYVVSQDELESIGSQVERISCDIQSSRSFR